jgi:protein SCO1/2
MHSCKKRTITLSFILLTLAWFSVRSAELPAPAAVGETRLFQATGVVRETRPGDGTIVISHGAISNYMAAMTMPFKVRDTGEITGLQRGDEITFRLHVAENESWVDGFVKIGTDAKVAGEKPVSSIAPAPPEHPLLEYSFTNELGQAVRLNDFRGQALAITFFYTRCPLPDYCPRLSKNFQLASHRLAALPGGPTNWHFLSISFDPEFDTPAMLKAYAESYRYDPARWSFLTGSPDKIAALARVAGLKYQADGNLINHDFRTLIIDAGGRLQMIFPTSGDLSDQIVSEMVKASSSH